MNNLLLVGLGGLAGWLFGKNKVLEEKLKDDFTPIRITNKYLSTIVAEQITQGVGLNQDDVDKYFKTLNIEINASTNEGTLWDEVLDYPRTGDLDTKSGVTIAKGKGYDFVLAADGYLRTVCNGIATEVKQVILNDSIDKGVSDGSAAVRFVCYYDDMLFITIFVGELRKFFRWRRNGVDAEETFTDTEVMKYILLCRYFDLYSNDGGLTIGVRHYTNGFNPSGLKIEVKHLPTTKVLMCGGRNVISNIEENNYRYMVPSVKGHYVLLSGKVLEKVLDRSKDFRFLTCITSTSGSSAKANKNWEVTKVEEDRAYFVDPNYIKNWNDIIIGDVDGEEKA